MTSKVFYGRALTSGRVEGRALVFAEPLSFWGGMDPHTGQVTDRRHPQLGVSLQGRVLVMPASRGSSSSSSVLAEAIRLGTAPAAIILAEADVIVALGAIIAEELYAQHCPVVLLAPDAYAAIADGLAVRVVGQESQARVEVLV